MKEIIEKYKKARAEEISAYCFPIQANGKMVGRLRPVTSETIHNEEEIGMLTEWRQTSREWFTTQFPVTEEGTRKWLKNEILQADDRILFFVDDVKLTPIGQVGLRHYDPQKQECEFDNLIRGRKGEYGNLMIYALIALGVWCMKVLDLQRGYLHVLADNFRATHIYEKLGFEEMKRVPLKKEEDGRVIRWLPFQDDPTGEIERELVTMVIRREVFEKLHQYNL